MTVDFVRTPEDRFANLADFPYEPRYVEVDGLRMAYTDEGSGDAGTFLLLHGEPTWGYLYRRMIPPLVDAGYRIIAPDLIGFGRSDKPTDRATYTYANHVAWLTEFVGGLERPADGFHVFVQDWGGLLGLRMIAEPAGLVRPRGDRQHRAARRRTDGRRLHDVAAGVAADWTRWTAAPARAGCSPASSPTPRWTPTGRRFPTSRTWQVPGVPAARSDLPR